MNSAPIARIALARKSRRERRDAGRDRRILDGTMKYRGEFMNIEVVDVSESGAFIIGPTVPEFSDSVTLAIELPAVGGSVMVSGRVRRVTMSSRIMRRSGGFGIEFTRYYTQVGQDSLHKHLAA